MFNYYVRIKTLSTEKTQIYIQARNTKGFSHIRVGKDLNNNTTSLKKVPSFQYLPHHCKGCGRAANGPN